MNLPLEITFLSKKERRLAWKLVFDKDDFPAVNFDAAIKKAASNHISCAWTNEAFELWFILHFQYMCNGHHKYSTHNPCTLVHELIEELLHPEEVPRKLEGSDNE